MGLPAWLRARRRRPVAPKFGIDQIEEVTAAFYQYCADQGNGWDGYRDAHLELPEWFKSGLDPWSTEYMAQQHRLWALIAGVDRPYDPDVDEQDEGWEDADPVRLPGFYRRRDLKAIDTAADHWLATGMLLKHSGLQAGDWALEYGPGFAQTALALARLGVNVDTVDISPRFCDFVRQQAEYFQVPLQAFQGRFGINPRSERRYDLIWFYESFHHCSDFEQVVPRLKQMLAPGGKVILGGEPIVEQPNAAIPYPWGVRLHSEVVAVIRHHRWFELGFTEAFLFELFARSGFVGRRIDCEPSEFGRLYTFDLSSS